MISVTAASWPFARLRQVRRSLRIHGNYLDKNGYGKLKLDFSDSGKIHYKHTSIILYDANYVIVFYPKQGVMCKLYLAKGWYENHL